jgi:hypothetical protein
MKQILLSLVISFFISCAGDKANKPEENASKNDYGSFKIKRGTTSHTGSHKARREVMSAQLSSLKKTCNTLLMRVSIIFAFRWTNSSCGIQQAKRNDDAFQLLDNFMNWANKAGLRVVLDLHILVPSF